MDTGLDQDIKTLEENNNYVNYSVMLLRGNTYDRGRVTGRKRDAYGNTVGR